MKISVIVPVYNVEKYLEHCISSICRQNVSSSEYEVILVNDGSTDGSKAIAERLSQEYSNTRLINQNNQGLSAARNAGISVASGDYVWCIDSDDEIKDCLAEIISDIERIGRPDMYGVVIDEVDKEGNHLKYQCDQPTLPHNVSISGRDAIIGGYNPSSACALVMRRDFLIQNDLRFMVGITHEDVEFTYRAMAKACSVYFSKHIAYLYYRWGNTMSTARDTERLLKYLTDEIDVAISFTELSKTVEDSELEMVILNRRNNILWGLLFSMFRNRKDWKSRGINSAVIGRMKGCGLYPLCCEMDSWKKRLSLVFLNKEFILD